MVDWTTKKRKTCLGPPRIEPRSPPCQFSTLALSQPGLLILLLSGRHHIQSTWLFQLKQGTNIRKIELCFNSNTGKKCFNWHMCFNRNVYPRQIGISPLLQLKQNSFNRNLVVLFQLKQNNYEKHKCFNWNIFVLIERVPNDIWEIFRNVSIETFSFQLKKGPND